MNTLAGEHLTPEFLKINPQHCVPTLVDNGEVIWDSHAICTYLGSKYNKTLCPNDNSYIRARIDQRLHYHHGTLFNRYYKVIAAIFSEGATEYNSNKQLQPIHQALEFLEIFVTESDYLVGDTLTVADILVLTTTNSVFKVLEVDASKYPKIAEWMKRVTKQLPSFDDIESSGVATMRSMLLQKIEANKASA